MRRIILATALLTIAGTATAQWWNPFENDCAKTARLRAEEACDDGRWKTHTFHGRQLFVGHEDCYEHLYSDAMNRCTSENN